MICPWSSLAAKKSGRLDGQDENHWRIEGEVGNFRKERLAKIIGQAHRQRADGRAPQTAHAADDHHGESKRQHLEVEARVDAKKCNATHAAESREKGAKGKDEHGYAIGIDADAPSHLSVVDGR